MNYTLAIFKSRSSTLNFANLLRANHVPVAIINTPQSASKMCGISVKFLSDFFSVVQSLLSSANLRNFDGFYAYIQRGASVTLVRL